MHAFDLFHQQVYRNMDFTIEADYTMQYPQYYVYCSRTGKLVGTTNANNFMGICRMIMNEYRRREGLQPIKEQIKKNRNYDKNRI